VTHANAPLTPEGRRRLALLITEEGWAARRAAERFQVSPATEYPVVDDAEVSKIIRRSHVAYGRYRQLALADRMAILAHGATAPGTH
jgi:transposase